MAKKYTKQVGLGVDNTQLIKRIEALNNPKLLNDAMTKVFNEVFGIAKADFTNFMIGHVQTGDTLASLLEKPKIKFDKKGQATFSYGFQISKGGLPALFFNYGAPTIEPYFFIDKTKDKIEPLIRKRLNEELKKALGEV